MAKENDIVLVYFEDKPFCFARIEKISPDVKKDWYHVELLMLQVPLQVATWILRDIYIDGGEFTMGGKRMRIEKVVCPKDDKPHAEIEEAVKKQNQKPKGDGTANVISLKDIKKK